MRLLWVPALVDQMPHHKNDHLHKVCIALSLDKAIAEQNWSLSQPGLGIVIDKYPVPSIRMDSSPLIADDKTLSICSENLRGSGLFYCLKHRRNKVTGCYHCICLDARLLDMPFPTCDLVRGL